MKERTTDTAPRQLNRRQWTERVDWIRKRVICEKGLFMRKLWYPTAVAGLIALSAGCVLGQGQTLAATPPMGWSTWNHFHHDISDAMVRAQADAMVASGMRDAGYVYVNIDGGWEGYRDSAGVLHPNESFPTTLSSRLNSKKDGVIIVVMQRLHQDDLVGNLLETEDQWEVLSLPVTRSHTERSRVPFPYS